MRFTTTKKSNSWALPETCRIRIYPRMRFRNFYFNELPSTYPYMGPLPRMVWFLPKVRSTRDMWPGISQTEGHGGR